jgi:hypothetical protein
LINDVNLQGAGDVAAAGSAGSLVTRTTTQPRHTKAKRWGRWRAWRGEPAAFTDGQSQVPDTMVWFLTPESLWSFGSARWWGMHKWKLAQYGGGPTVPIVAAGSKQGGYSMTLFLSPLGNFPTYSANQCGERKVLPRYGDDPTTPSVAAGGNTQGYMTLLSPLGISPYSANQFCGKVIASTVWGWPHNWPCCCRQQSSQGGTIWHSCHRWGIPHVLCYPANLLEK